MEVSRGDSDACLGTSKSTWLGNLKKIDASLTRNVFRYQQMQGTQRKAGFSLA